jgi:hypothetical protein
MSRWSGTRALCIRIISAAISLTAGGTLLSSDSKPQCSSAPCSYFERGQQFPGTCGVKAGDAKACYCFKRETEQNTPGRGSKREPPSQLQAGCKK